MTKPSTVVLAMKPSTVLLVTSIVMAATLIFPWTDVVTWETEPTGIAPPSGNAAVFIPDRSTRWQGKERRDIPYPFFYTGKKSAKMILWDETFYILGAEALLGFGLFVYFKSKPQMPIDSP